MLLKKKIYSNQKILFSLLKGIAKIHPYFVVIILHEYFRNIFPHDPHIKFKINNPFIRINNLQKNCISLIKNIKKFGTYNINFKNLHNDELKLIGEDIPIAYEVYEKLFRKFDKKENLRAKNFVIERFSDFKSYNKSFFKNKKIIDVGCGGGRYTNALALLGARNVTGVDFGEGLLKIAKKNYKNKKIRFVKQNVLNLKFKSNTFDVVFCNGVLHHTKNLYKGIKEVYRICKPNGYIFLYLFAQGGIFWNARKEMNKLMKLIPQDYSQKILDLIGMPSNRHIFMDNWYVPIEKHTKHKKIYNILKSLGSVHIEKMKKGRKTDLEYGLKKFKNSEDIWGEGEIRILIKK